MKWYVNVLSTSCFFVNVICLVYALKTFNYKNSSNYIMYIDSSISALASLLVLITSLINTQDSLSCSIMVFAALSVTFLFPIYNFTNAYTR